MSDPESLLADLLTPGQQASSGQLSALTTAIGGYVDTSRLSCAEIDRLGGALSEAWYRYRTADAKASRQPGGSSGWTSPGAGRSRRRVRPGVLERSGEEGSAGSSQRHATCPRLPRWTRRASGWSGSTSRGAFRS